MDAKELDSSIHDRIRVLCAKGDELVQKSRFQEAFSFYSDALQLLPEPVETWEAATWILAAIGDVYFLARRYDKGAKAFEDAVRCPGGLGNPFIHLRIGQCHLELGNGKVAADELMRAYMGGGKEIFQDQDPKYLDCIRHNIHQ